MIRGNIYIAGPINGVKDYKKAFDRAKVQFEKDGWDVVSPAEIKGETTRLIMATELDWIARCADAMYMLRGWEKSFGAIAEHAVAVAIGLQIIYQT